MREVKLPSGAILKIGQVPFETSKSLYQAVLRGLQHVSLKSDGEMANLYKDFFCTGFTSPEIEHWLWKCLERCTYNACGIGDADLKIDGGTFELRERRQDYVPVCVEVAKDNIDPFAKSLYVEYQRYLAMIANIRT